MYLPITYMQYFFFFLIRFTTSDIAHKKVNPQRKIKFQTFRTQNFVSNNSDGRKAKYIRCFGSFNPWKLLKESKIYTRI